MVFEYSALPSSIQIISMFLTGEKCTPADIHRRLCAMYGADNIVSLALSKDGKNRSQREERT